MTLTSNQIRSQFYSFFEAKGHTIVPSAPIVQKDDPTLMFTNAGMNQFKDIFLGDKEPKHSRVANSQKCLRVSGKHNDLEEVGVDTYHHTMFEMLGNWSFGDYFKKEAISWAWELLTREYGIDQKDLYVTYFGGDETDGLEPDEEAKSLWEQVVPAERVLPFGKKDNFWEMGEVGPCGPSSEIHIDLRPEEDKKKIPGKELVNKDNPLVIELWNLVFIEYNRKKSGELRPLPQKHVDTGMGLERLAMVLQHKTANYDTDLFETLIGQIEAIAGVTYHHSNSKKDIALRVIADHVRAVSFCIADGQLPSNGGAGYVVRRILRRAIRYGFSFLSIKEAFIYSLVSVVVKTLGDNFVELQKQEALIKDVIKEEEENFLRTLDKGIERLESVSKTVKGDTIDGRVIFELYDTYGFPVDLTELVLKDLGKTADMKGFEEELNQQKQRSKKASEVDTEDWVVLLEDDREEFIGYDQTEAQVRITRYRKVTQKKKSFYHLVFNLTPFYAEGGGQVGDKGKIFNKREEVAIWNTKKENDLIIHYADKLPDNPEAVFQAEVDTIARNKTAANHSATHLLHHALRSVLGEHVEQKGSLVHPNYLRFDFSHFQKLSEKEIETIEREVNLSIRKNISLEEKRNIPFDQARELGAIALFGEKYGDLVRMIQFGNSKELCGGTHVKATGGIGFFKIISESAVASGVRRIEALTGFEAEKHVQETSKALSDLKGILKSNDPVRSVSELQKKTKELEKELAKLNQKAAGSLAQDLLDEAKPENGVKLIHKVVEMDERAFKDLSFQLIQGKDDYVVLLANKSQGKVTLNLAISKNLVKDKDLNAGSIIREIAKEIKGGGGGQPFFASAGGKDPEGIEAAFQKLKGYL